MLDRPLLTWLACALCLGMTVAWHLFAWGRHDRVALIGGLGYLPAQEIWKGGFYALLTSAFVHGSPSMLSMTAMHLGFNLLWLFVLGSWIEAELSRAVWAAFFVLAAVVSAASELAVSGQAAHGVSGVVYAMFGLMWAGRRAIPSWAEIATYKNLQVFVWWGVFCIVATLFGWLQVANAAHFGGLYFGFAFGYLFIARRRKALSAAALAALAAVSVCAVVWMPWSIRWSNWKASSLALRGDYAGAIEWHRHAIWLGDDPSAGLNRILLLELARGNPDGVRRAREELSRLPGAAGVGM